MHDYAAAAGAVRICRRRRRSPSTFILRQVVGGINVWVVGRSWELHMHADFWGDFSFYFIWASLIPGDRINLRVGEKHPKQQRRGEWKDKKVLQRISPLYLYMCVCCSKDDGGGDEQSNGERDILVPTTQPKSRKAFVYESQESLPKLSYVHIRAVRFIRSSVITPTSPRCQTRRAKDFELFTTL